MKKPDIKGLSITEMEEFAVSIGEKKFRGKQLFDWLYNKEASSFDDMSSLSKTLREKLSDIASIDSIKVLKVQESADGTKKFLFELNDGKKIESVLIPSRIAFENSDLNEEGKSRLTLCLSTQVGCPLDCKFCATGTMGFTRNLTTSEIIDQILQVKKYSGKKITNLVYMGMGEPLLNYDNVMKSIEIISTGMGIAARRITVSTVGIIPQIKKISNERRKMKLAISLHSLDQTFREMLMPISKKYKLEDLLDTIQYYYRKTKLRPTFEYILFDGKNDREEDIKLLINLSKKIPCKVNIIPFHKINIKDGKGIVSRLHPTTLAKAEEFAQRLREAHLTVFIRSSAGEDIDAACGQLAVKSVWIKKNQSSLILQHANTGIV